MATNKAHQAIQKYTGELQKIVSCVVNEVCYVFPTGQDRLSLAWSSGTPLESGPLRLKRNDGQSLFVDINQQVDNPSVTKSDTITTKYYLYSILDEERRDLIGFHYHPELDDDPVSYPHIHVYADADERFSFFDLHRRHIPSGRVALEDVIEWLIAELDVIAIRKDWPEVLEGTREHFKEVRTWS